MATLDEQFTKRLITRFGQRAMTWVRPKIPSITLQKALNLFVLSPIHARMQIPHYWAVYVHDGRGPFGPRRAQFLVWFSSPLLDPRLRAGVTPVRAHQLRELNKSQFEFWLAKNREARLRGETPPMIITKYVKTPQRARLFFSNGPRGGMQGFVHQANQTGSVETRKHFQNRLRDVMNIRDGVTVVL